MKKEFASLVRATLDYLQVDPNNLKKSDFDRSKTPLLTPHNRTGLKSTRDASKTLEDEGEKPKTQVHTNAAAERVPLALERGASEQSNVVEEPTQSKLEISTTESIEPAAPHWPTRPDLPQSKPQESKQPTNWVLNPLPLPIEELIQYSSFFPTHPLPIPIQLVLINPEEIFFLENVARALTKLIAPAALYTGKIDSLLTNKTIQLVCAPHTFLQKRFPQIALHQYYKTNGLTLLPLADHYDLNLKTALWNTLKCFPSLPQSS